MDLDPDPVEKNIGIRIRIWLKKKEIQFRIWFVTRGWIRIQIRSISDRIRNPGLRTMLKMDGVSEKMLFKCSKF